MLKLWFPLETLELPSGIGSSFYISPSLQRLHSSPFAYLQFSGRNTLHSGADVPNTENTSGVNVPCSMDITR